MFVLDFLLEVGMDDSLDTGTKVYRFVNGGVIGRYVVEILGTEL